MSEYEAVIGLEVHAQLQTETKIFCGCKNRFGSAPNSNTCPVCLGLPGALPVLNRLALEYAVRMGIATNCTVAGTSVFARKNYFYPDLPKGYQISQYDQPICQNGWLEIVFSGKKTKIGINRIHLEEDAGKSVHAEQYVDEHTSLIDLNRCGTPLIEIVSEPHLRDPGEAVEYLKQLRQILQYLNICDGNMEEGSLRCDANISLRKSGTVKLGTKTELKNMNSFRNVEKALMFEINRQREIISTGGKVEQATLLWDADRNEARVMRSKEEAHDYRYFPEPDLVPCKLSEATIAEWRSKVPELPGERKIRFEKEYHLPEYDAELLTAEKGIADYFEAVTQNLSEPKLISNWMMGEVMRWLNEQNREISGFPVTPVRLAELLGMLAKNTLNSNGAKKIFQAMLETGEPAARLIDKLNLRQVSDSDMIETLVDKIINENPAEAEAYRNGKDKLFGFFMGQAMRASKGQANPQIIAELLRKKLTKI